MENTRLYQDIAKRTDGDIYVGVVGPVRTGKSTFIKKFMDLLVIPNIDNEYTKVNSILEFQATDASTLSVYPEMTNYPIISPATYTPNSLVNIYYHGKAPNTPCHFLQKLSLA